ncbi:MAG TPA: hypothetical protein VF808_02040 [Ktedonobacterales bacterium]
MEASAARARQRAWLFNTIILAQALITLALAPASIIPTLDLPMLISLAVGMLVYIAAFATNRFARKFTLALTLLIAGGGLVVAAQVFLNAFIAHSSAHTAQSALFFLPVVIEAGLFVTPDLTLIIAGSIAVITASGILISLSLEHSSTTPLGAAYQVMVYALGLDALVGYMSWQLAMFINEKITVAQTVEDLRFAQARLDALQLQMGEQKRQLQREAGIIQAAVSSMLSHEYDTRVEIVDGELAPLAESLNLLFERLRSTNELERKVQRMEAGVPPLVDFAERIADAGTPAQSQDVGLLPDAALFPVSVALTNAQTAQARRLASIFQLSSDVVDALRDNRQVLERAATDSVSARRQAGELVSLAHTLAATALQEIELLGQARRLLARLLPRELRLNSAPGERDPLYAAPTSTPLGTGALDGLGQDIGLLDPELFPEMPEVAPGDGPSEKIAPMTLPILALDAKPAEPDDEQAVFAPGELPGELVNSWDMLRDLHVAAAHEQLQLSVLARDMGVLSRLVRQTDANVVWAIQALDAAQKRAEQAQSLSGGSGGDQPGDSIGRPAPSSASRRPPLPTRPLEPDNRLPDANYLAQPEIAQPSTPAPGSIRVQDLLNLDPPATSPGPNSAGQTDTTR